VVAGYTQTIAGGSDAYDSEYRIIRPSDGAIRWIFGRGRVIRDLAGNPVHYSGIDIDITERKLAEAALAESQAKLEAAVAALGDMNQKLEQRVSERTAELEAEAARRIEAEARLVQAQKMEAVGQLTGGMAHDFNNLLTVILGNLDMVRRRLEGEARDAPDRAEKLLRPVEMAMQGARNAAQLTHRLLAFSRRQPLEPRAFEVNKLVEGMSEMIGRMLGETIEVKQVLAPDAGPIFADANQLESALLNLVVNARDAMHDGGRLTIETANIRFEEPETAAAEDIAAGDYVMLGVSDTGAGIAPEFLDKVFEPFFTTKETGKGSGLGLSMVYGFVKQSGGHVRVYSEVGLGTTVKIYLPRLSRPLTEAMPAPRRPTEAPLIRARPGETILLVEDNDGVRRYGVSALEDLGYRVLAAADGAAALHLLDSEAGRIDLLFTDIVLPGGMSGRAVAEEARARLPDLPVLFTTGYAAGAVFHGRQAEENVHLLGKPYTLDGLARKVRQVIDAGAALT
jgi:signal transduction histidine kinase/ActR/RegA family two-component response regulator